MKKHLFVISIFTVSIASGSLFAKPKDETIQSELVIRMAQTNLDDHSTNAFIELKENHVSDTIVNQMVYKRSTNEISVKQNTSMNDDEDNPTFKAAGMYFKLEDKFLPLDPTDIGEEKFSKKKTYISGKHANYQFNQGTEFYFDFTPMKKGTKFSSPDNYMEELMGRSSQGVSLQDFKLVKLDDKWGKRVYRTKKNKIHRKSEVQFRYQKVSEYTYRIIFSSTLTPGEYCFVYAKNIGAGYNPFEREMVYDFGVR